MYNWIFSSLFDFSKISSFKELNIEIVLQIWYVNIGYILNLTRLYSPSTDKILSFSYHILLIIWSLNLTFKQCYVKMKLYRPGLDFGSFDSQMKVFVINKSFFFIIISYGT